MANLVDNSIGQQADQRIAKLILFKTIVIALAITAMALVLIFMLMGSEDKVKLASLAWLSLAGVAGILELLVMWRMDMRSRQS